MACKIVRILRDIGKHGVHSKYLQGDAWQSLFGVVGNIVGKYTGSELTDAEKQAMTAEQNFNAQEAEKARQFEKEQADTAYQRKVADLQKAGLNPALAVGSAGSPVASGNAASASVSSPQMGDILGLMLQMQQNNRQMNIQKDIAEKNINLERASLASQIELKSRELNLKEKQYLFDKDLREREFGLKQKSVDKTIEEIDANLLKIAEETNNEKKKGLLLDTQKRIADADAEAKEAFAAVAKDTYQAELDLLKARTSEARNSAQLAFEQALATAVERGYKEKLYTEEFIDAQVNSVIEQRRIFQWQRYQSVRDAWKSYVVQRLMQGKPVEDWTFTHNGKQYKISAPNEKELREMRKGLGLDGPTTQSSSWSESTNTHYFGGWSESGSSTSSYGSNWKR